jgi:hypothetical protein
MVLYVEILYLWDSLRIIITDESRDSYQIIINNINF